MGKKPRLQSVDRKALEVLVPIREQFKQYLSPMSLPMCRIFSVLVELYTQDFWLQQRVHQRMHEIKSRGWDKKDRGNIDVFQFIANAYQSFHPAKGDLKYQNSALIELYLADFDLQERVHSIYWKKKSERRLTKA